MRYVRLVDGKEQPYTNWVCAGYRMRMKADDAGISRYQLSFKEKQIRRRIRSANRADRFSRLNIPKHSIAGNSTRSLFSHGKYV